MANQAYGLLETRGLIALVHGTDTMLKSANVELIGSKSGVGNALVNAVITGDVASVKAALDAGAAAAATVGEVLSAHVIARPHSGVMQVMPAAPAAKPAARARK